MLYINSTLSAYGLALAMVSVTATVTRLAASEGAGANSGAPPIRASATPDARPFQFRRLSISAPRPLPPIVELSHSARLGTIPKCRLDMPIHCAWRGILVFDGRWPI